MATTKLDIWMTRGLEHEELKMEVPLTQAVYYLLWGKEIPQALSNLQTNIADEARKALELRPSLREFVTVFNAEDEAKKVFVKKEEFHRRAIERYNKEEQLINEKLLVLEANLKELNKDVLLAEDKVLSIKGELVGLEAKKETISEKSQKLETEYVELLEKQGRIEAQRRAVHNFYAKQKELLQRLEAELSEVGINGNVGVKVDIPGMDQISENAVDAFKEQCREVEAARGELYRNNLAIDSEINVKRDELAQQNNLVTFYKKQIAYKVLPIEEEMEQLDKQKGLIEKKKYGETLLFNEEKEVMTRYQDNLKVVEERVAVEDREVNEEEAKRLKEEQDRERQREKAEAQKAKAKERRMAKRDQRKKRATKRREEDELLDKYIDLTVFERCFELLDDDGYMYFKENADAIVELSDADMKTLHGLFLQAKDNYSFLKEVDSPLVLLQLVGQVLQYGSEQYEAYYDVWKLAVGLSADPCVSSIDVIDLVIDPIRDLDDVGEVATLDTKIRITRIAIEAAKLLQGGEGKEVSEDEKRLIIELKKMALDHIRTDPENESLQELLRYNYHEAVVKSVNDAVTVGRAV